MKRRTVWMLLALGVLGCGGSARQSTAVRSQANTRRPNVVTPTAAPVASSAPTEPAATPIDPAIEAFKAHVTRREFVQAENDLTRAAQLAGNDLKLRRDVAYYRATLAAYRGDYEAAAQALLAIVPELAAQPAFDYEFWAHNSLMMLREAQGDLAAALVECDEMTLAGLRGTWSAEDVDRETLVWLKDLWHRAYLLRMMAETRSGSRREAALRYAEAARLAYQVRAQPHPQYQDSIAVLEGYFAALANNREVALAAAGRVRVADNTDLEDLYLTATIFHLAGDTATAAQIREKIRLDPQIYLARPIMLKWIDSDLQEKKRKQYFSPLHPSAPPDRAPPSVE